MGSAGVYPKYFVLIGGTEKARIGPEIPIRSEKKMMGRSWASHCWR